MRTSTTTKYSALMGSSLALLIVFAPHSASALTVSPARIEIAGDPGQTISSEFDLINEQDSAQTFYTSSENFEAQGESGAPSFVQSNSGLSTWISVIPTVTLQKHEEKKIPFTVTIPKNTDPGGYFAAVFLGTTPTTKSEGGQVSIGARIGVLVLLRVSGDVKESAGLLSFSTENGSHFFTSLPVSFTYRFSNAGNDRIEPTGNLIIKDTIGISAANLAANPSEGNILPNSIRKFDVLWGDPAAENPNGFWNSVGYEWSHFAFGIYNAYLDLGYGSHNTPANASLMIFVFPWQLILVIIVIAAALVLISTKGIKRYNKYIIEAARK